MSEQVIVSWKGMTYALRDGKWFYLDNDSKQETWIGPFASLQQAIDAS